VATDDALDRDELRTIALRAFAMARASDDPSLRAAVNLLGEAAANLAAKLPADPSGATEAEGER
jgi:hypothetical protein